MGIIKKIFKLILLLVAISILVFLLVGCLNNGSAHGGMDQASYTHLSAEKKAQLNEAWGTEIPVTEKYVSWVKGIFRGDLGTSLYYNADVSDVIKERFGNSLLLIITAWLLSGLIGAALGLWSGLKRNKAPDKIIKGFAMVLTSVPLFWLGLLMIMVFALALGWFPTSLAVPIGVSAADVTIIDRLYHMILPALTLSTVGIASMTLHTREKVLEISRSDYVLFAKARGEDNKSIIKHHYLRNLLVPVLTLQFGSLSEIIGGTILIEAVFSYPGIGQAAVTAGLNGDAPLLCAIAMICTLMVCITSFAGDILIKKCI